MKRSPALAWLLLLVWSAWLLALQGLFAARAAVGAWTPDLGLVLLLGLGAGLGRRQAVLAALIVAGARTAFTSDPPLAVLVGYLAVIGVAGWLRGVLEIDRPLARVLVAAVLTLVLAAYWSLASRIALGPDALALPPPGWAWTNALATGAAALVLAPLLMRLPGLSPLRRARA